MFYIYGSKRRASACLGTGSTGWREYRSENDVSVCVIWFRLCGEGHTLRGNSHRDASVGRYCRDPPSTHTDSICTARAA